jgi:putative transcriptional regulator
MKLKSGNIIVAEPFMGDPNFERTVVLLCEYTVQGAFGLILNQESDYRLNDILGSTIFVEMPLYIGGPVQKDTLHFIHKRHDLIKGGLELLPGLFWGGDFEDAVNCLNMNRLAINEIMFFIGYSGWGAGQLEDEVNRNSWMISKIDLNTILNQNPKLLWREVLKKMGGDFKVMANYPTDPRLN